MYEKCGSQYPVFCFQLSGDCMEKAQWILMRPKDLGHFLHVIGEHLENIYTKSSDKATP